MQKDNIEDIYSLTPMQKGILFHYIMNPECNDYKEQLELGIEGSFHVSNFWEAVLQTSHRYDALRTLFSFQKTDEPMQVVLKVLEPEFYFEECHSEFEMKDSFKAYKLKDLQRGFNLNKEVLFRVALFQAGKGKYRILFSFHHIILDGWSLMNVIESIFSFYDGKEENSKERHPYKNYLVWLEKQENKEAETYWKEYLNGYSELVKLPRKQTAKEDTKQEITTFAPDSELMEQINEICAEYDITQSTYFKTAWGILLQKYNYSEDIVFGNVLSGRPADMDGINDMVGLFINTLPLRVTSHEKDNFVSVAQRIQQQYYEANGFEYYPLFEIQKNCAVKDKLINHVMAFENYPSIGKDSGEEETYQINDFQMVEYTNYEFYIIINPMPELKITMAYNTIKYSKEMVDGIARSYLALMKNICDAPMGEIKQLSICSQKDKDIINMIYNNTDRLYPDRDTLISLFHQVCETSPDKEALISGKWSISYRQLDLWSDEIAREIQKAGDVQNTPVGLIAARNVKYVAGILGILKAGGIYVPLDVAANTERNTFIIEDAGLRVICNTDSKNPYYKENICCIDIWELPEVLDMNIDFVLPKIDSDDKACLIYTSGSTGRPKGCYITHNNVTRNFFSQEFMEFGSQNVSLLMGSPAFDSSMFDIWGTLLHGGTLVIAEVEDIMDTTKFKEILNRWGINTLLITPALFDKLCMENADLFSSLWYLLIGGDVVTMKYVKKVMEINPQIKVRNMYGPTENSILSTYYAITEKDMNSVSLPIGKSVNNSKSYIIDKGMNILPPGAVGELCVGGKGVSQGYHERQELTNEKFILLKEEDLKVYRTGDLCCCMEEGHIMFYGRIDNQVKVNGFRIELPEIEKIICDYEGIEECCTVIHTLGDEKKICAYLTLKTQVNMDGLKSFLKIKLPHYMIPQYFIPLEAFPLNVNGKIDRKELEVRNIEESPLLMAAKENTTSGNLLLTEEKLREILKEVLHIGQNFGTEINFFELGATSLSLLTIRNRIRRELDVDIPLTALFQYTNVKKLACYIDNEESESEITNQEPVKDNSKYKKNISLMRNQMKK